MPPAERELETAIEYEKTRPEGSRAQTHLILFADNTSSIWIKPGYLSQDLGDSTGLRQ